MAETQSNARPCADAGVPTSGVIHVRTRLTANFTVIANALAQRPGSAVTVGVATYILSLPDGAPVSIAALCELFIEGEILISRALQELEDAGYLERRRERGLGGQIRTRTTFYNVPVAVAVGVRGRGRPTPPPPAPPRPRMRKAADVPEQAPQPEAAAPDARPPAPTGETGQPGPMPGPMPGPTPGSTPEPTPEPAPPQASGPEPAPATAPTPAPRQPAPPLADADPLAIVILASLRIVDRRLILSQREVAELAPAVTQWLAQGVGHKDITDLLTVGLPDRFRARPAKLLAFRLSERPVAAPPPPAKPVVLPWQTCDGGCDRPFRAAQPGRCRDCPPRDCPPREGMTDAGAAVDRDEFLRTAC
ncbi:hypothetical protein [Streptomyces sp. H27-D2]|uniref:hypothetical protein n=1 Tax=Streptomyces sp. H27-D2 TaxID=3046304 RepID=UPI002DBD43F7|nr:hypothetical protein [Streptomyces sp. H27-D2]MEC4020024.1 hypothetical protein [Streptomyces sp. H27-D2]